MREIKFRQWVPEKNRFHYFNIFSNFMMSPLFLPPLHKFDEDQYIDKYPISQYTGVEGSKEVEIYEGDIVTVPGLVEPFVISISPELGVFYNSDSDQHGWSYSECSCEGDLPTVIGNIYENPELLTAKPDKE